MSSLTKNQILEVLAPNLKSKLGEGVRLAEISSEPARVDGEDQTFYFLTTESPVSFLPTMLDALKYFPPVLTEDRVVQLTVESAEIRPLPQEPLWIPGSPVSTPPQPSLILNIRWKVKVTEASKSVALKPEAPEESDSSLVLEKIRDELGNLKEEQASYVRRVAELAALFQYERERQPSLMVQRPFAVFKEVWQSAGLEPLPSGGYLSDWQLKQLGGQSQNSQGLYLLWFKIGISPFSDFGSSLDPRSSLEIKLFEESLFAKMKSKESFPLRTSFNYPVEAQIQDVKLIPFLPYVLNVWIRLTGESPWQAAEPNIIDPMAAEKSRFLASKIPGSVSVWARSGEEAFEKIPNSPVSRLAGILEEANEQKKEDRPACKYRIEERALDLSSEDQSDSPDRSK